MTQQYDNPIDSLIADQVPDRADRIDRFIKTRVQALVQKQLELVPLEEAALRTPTNEAKQRLKQAWEEYWALLVGTGVDVPEGWSAVEPYSGFIKS